MEVLIHLNTQPSCGVGSGRVWGGAQDCLRCVDSRFSSSRAKRFSAIEILQFEKFFCVLLIAQAKSLGKRNLSRSQADLTRRGSPRYRSHYIGWLCAWRRLLVLIHRLLGITLKIFRESPTHRPVDLFVVIVTTRIDSRSDQFFVQAECEGGHLLVFTKPRVLCLPSLCFWVSGWSGLWRCRHLLRLLYSFFRLL